MANNCMQEASENREGERATENLDECLIRIMKQLYDIEWRIWRVEYEYKTEKIEKSLVKFKCEHIKSEITIMNGVLQMEAYPNPEYLKDHVEGKLKCVIEEVDDVISFKLKSSGEEVVEDIIDPHEWLRRHESSSSSDSKLGLVQKDEIEVSKWLSIIAKRMEKIRMLVSQFSPQPEQMPPISYRSRLLEKRLSNRSACIDMCIEESLLISPMITSLKKSYDHLPTNLKLCSLCLAAFPERFVIIKIPLIYWWMAEGFITETEEGEENFMELIRLGFIEPFYYEDEAKRLSSLGIVGACRVHPWIRRMLVSIAMDTQFFEFYGRQLEKKKISTTPSPAASGFDGRPAHACLFWDEGAELENYCSFMWIIKILGWLKPALVVCEKEIINKEIKEANNTDGVKGYRHMQEVWDMLFAFRLLILCVSKLLVYGLSDRISPWDGDEKPEALLEKIRELETDIHQNEKDVQVLFKKQNKMLTDLNKVLMWAKQQVHVLEMQVYHRRRNRQELQHTEQLFARYDLSHCSSSSPPIHRQWGGKAPLLAIINVNQGYLNLEELLVFGGKLNKLRTLHLGMWNHWQGHTSRLKHSSVWVVVAKLMLLRTLKGVALTQDADLISLNSQITPHNLMTLSVIVNFNINEVCNLQRFSNLHALKITWPLGGDLLADRYGFELPPQLRKLQLKRYPGENWPAWLKRHPTLETLHFSYSWGITAFPDDLMLPKLQVLILPGLPMFNQDIVELGVEDSSTQGDTNSAAPTSLGLQIPVREQGTGLCLLNTEQATIPTVSLVAHHTKAPVTKTHSENSVSVGAIQRCGVLPGGV
nr:disease resistance RPP13-like protein 4 [Ipomoea batatas]